jgi:hypothetical protein
MSETRQNQSDVCCGHTARGLQVRLFLTCWLIYFLHFSPFVTRELYLTLALAERQTVHVDDYVPLHPDLFVIEGRGSFLGANPGTSILAAVPYALFLPLVNKMAPVHPPRAGEEVQAETKDPRFMRQMFYKRARQMGIEVRLGLAAMITAGFFMAPLAAASAVLMFRMFRDLQFGGGTALWLAFLYALGTPVFFRSATMSLNLLVALLAFAALALLWWPGGSRPDLAHWRLIGAGFLAGYGVLTDYSGAVPAAGLGVFAFVQQLRERPLWPALAKSLWYVAGAAGPVAFLLWWQWHCYGNPWLPVQYYMPVKFFQNYPSERGFGMPQAEGLWGLLFDPLYGLLIFAPIFLIALYHVALLRKKQNRVPAGIAVFIWSFSAAFWVFCSMIHYTLRHQWQDGVRYIVPVVPLLFVLVGDVLARIPRRLAYLISAAAVAETWCLAMVRGSPLDSVVRVFTQGPSLPSVSSLANVASKQFPQLESAWLPLMLISICAAAVYAVWRIKIPARRTPAA